MGLTLEPDDHDHDMCVDVDDTGEDTALVGGIHSHSHQEHEIEVREVAPRGLEKADPSQFELLKVCFLFFKKYQL